MMNWIVGCDFTSAPSRQKPLVNAWLASDGGVVELDEIRFFSTFADWEADLASRTSWIGCFDFPFSLPRMFLSEVGWPSDWATVTALVSAMTKEEFLSLVREFASAQPYGSKEPSRRTERAVGSFSAIKLGRPSMARMAYEGISKLRTVADRVFPYWGAGDRVVVEAYAGVVARRIVGRRSYKGPREDQAGTRLEILAGLASAFGIELLLPDGFAEVIFRDREGDQLDALIAGLQGWWAIPTVVGSPNLVDVEGFIADPKSLPLLDL